MHDTTHTLKGEGFDASEDGTGRGVPLIPVAGGAPMAFSCKDHGADAGELAPTLRGMGADGSHANGGGQLAIAFNARQDPDSWTDRTGPLDTDGHSQAVNVSMAVRRLTPVECERLQGFPDHWTQIPYRGKPSTNCPDGPRYKAIGNSMAVTVMEWLGQRIDDEVKCEKITQL